MNTTTKRIVSLIRRTINLFIAHEENLQIDASEFGRSLRIAITAHRADTPRIIGEKGATIQALKGIVEQIGKKNGIGVWLQVREPEVGDREPTRPFEVREDWNRQEFCDWITGLASEIFPSCESQLSEDFPDGMNILEMSVTYTETHESDNRIEEAIQTLVKAIGMANGRRIHVHIVE